MEGEKEAINKVIKMILESEPRCDCCDHCYYFTNKKKCKEEQQRITKAHENWEQRLKLWKERERKCINYDESKS